MVRWLSPGTGKDGEIETTKGEKGDRHGMKVEDKHTGVRTQGKTSLRSNARNVKNKNPEALERG